MRNVFLVEYNVHGAVVIYGALGVKQYYGYTKSEALKMYKEEASRIIFTNKNK